MTQSGDRTDFSEGFSLTVLQVLPSLDAGGVERGTVDVAAAVIAAGGKAIVVSAGGRLEADLKRIGATHIKMPVDRKTLRHMWRNTGRLARLIRREKVDIIHARSRAPAWSARAAARRADIPFVTTFHGVYNFSGPLKKAWNSIMTAGDRVIAISEFVAQHIRDHYRTAPERIEVIHRGVDFDLFDPKAVPAARVVQLAEEWRLPDGAEIIMLPARFARWKGHRVLIDAMAKLDRPHVLAVLVGDPAGRETYADELLKQVKKLKLEGSVRFVGHCRDMPAAFMLADIVVSTSTDPEAFGRVSAEAQAMGRPVIATNHGGSTETVIPGKTGWLVPPNDPQALADALDEALSVKQNARERMALAGTMHIRQNFSKQAMTTRTLEVYAELVRQRQGLDGRGGGNA